jgi:hypothetical protein
MNVAGQAEDHHVTQGLEPGAESVIDPVSDFGQKPLAQWKVGRANVAGSADLGRPRQSCDGRAQREANCTNAVEGHWRCLRQYHRLGN